MTQLLALIALLVALLTGSVPTLPPCATDEAETGIPACYWDAHTQGNSTGQSYIWTGSTTIYIDSHTK